LFGRLKMIRRLTYFSPVKLCVGRSPHLIN